MSSATVTSGTASRSVLEEAPPRALAFLRAAGKVLAIRKALEGAGYSPADHEEGWKLLHTIAGYGELATGDEGTVKAIDDAQAAIEAWVVPSLSRAQLALGRRHPEQEDFVFNNLVAERGPAAILAAKTFVDRCSALATSPKRKATRKADGEALKTLERRGITKSERERIGTLIELVHTHREPLPEGPALAVEGERLTELRALHAWLSDWRGTARIVIRRRDHLLRLGIGKRRARTADVAEKPASPTAPPNDPVDDGPNSEGSPTPLGTRLRAA